MAGGLLRGGKLSARAGSGDFVFERRWIRADASPPYLWRAAFLKSCSTDVVILCWSDGAPGQLVRSRG